MVQAALKTLLLWLWEMKAAMDQKEFLNISCQFH